MEGQFLSGSLRVYLDQEKWNCRAEMESESSSGQTVDMHSRHSRSASDLALRLPTFQWEDERHGHSHNPRRAMITWPWLLGSLGLGQLSQPEAEFYFLLPTQTPPHAETENTSSEAIVCCYVIHLFSFGCRTVLQGEFQGLQGTHSSSSCYDWLWSRGKEQRFIQGGNNPRPFSVSQQSYVFVNQSLPEAQASLPSVHTWENSLPCLLPQPPTKGMAMGEQERLKQERLKPQNPPGMSHHPFSDLSRNFKARLVGKSKSLEPGYL